MILIQNIMIKMNLELKLKYEQNMGHELHFKSVLDNTDILDRCYYSSSEVLRVKVLADRTD